MSDLLGELVQTIETLRERIGMYSLELSKNEIRTRTVLIDPLLKALGWDVTDPSLVTVEYDAGHGRADYGLRRSLEYPPVVLVEAKKLNEPLAPHVGQLLGYALDRGTEYGCITDGNVWEVYRAFQVGVPVEERKLLSVTVTEEKGAKVALSILGLWRRSLQDGSFKQAAEPLVTSESESPVETHKGLAHGDKSHSDSADNQSSITAKESKVRHFTPDEVRDIRNRRGAGETYTSIAKSLGVHSTSVRNVALHISHKDID